MNATFLDPAFLDVGGPRRLPGVSGGELVVHGGLEFVNEIGAVERARISAARPHCPNPTREMNEWGCN